MNKTIYVVAITSEVDIENCKLPLAQTVDKCDKCNTVLEHTRRTATFNTPEKAYDWINNSGEIDTVIFDVELLKINVWEKVEV